MAEWSNAPDSSYIQKLHSEMSGYANSGPLCGRRFEPGRTYFLRFCSRLREQRDDDVDGSSAIFRPKTRPGRGDASVFVRGGVSIFSRNTLSDSLHFFVRADARAAERERRRLMSANRAEKRARRVEKVTRFHHRNQRINKRRHLSPISSPTRMFIAASSLARYLNTNGNATVSYTHLTLPTKA